MDIQTSEPASQQFLMSLQDERDTESARLKPNYVEALARAFPDLRSAPTVDAAYWALAVRFDAPADVSLLPTRLKHAVLRRLLFHNPGGDPASNFVAWSIREMKKANRLRLKEREKTAGEKRRAAKEVDRAVIKASLTLPVSKIAGQAEHLVVLAALPDAAFRRTPEWRRTRYQAIERARSRCMSCGRGPKDGAVLEARHIVSRIAAPERAFDLFNIRVVCTDCGLGGRTLVASKAGLPE